MKRSDRTFEIEIIGNVQIGNIPKENWELFVTAIAEKIEELAREESEETMGRKRRFSPLTYRSERGIV